MKKQMVTRVAIIAVAIATLNLNCCMLTLGALGALADASSPPSKLAPARDVMILEPGKKVTLLLKDGREVKGRYVGMKSVPDTEYTPQYADFLARKSNKCVLPALNDTLTIATVSTSDIECTMRGFDFESICVSPIGQGSPGQVSIRDIARLEIKNGPDVDLKSVRELLAAGEAPCRSVVIIISRDTTVSVQPTSIGQVMIYHAGKAAMSGAVIGAVCDYLVLQFVGWRFTETAPDECCLPHGCIGP